MAMLASQQKCEDRIQTKWNPFQAKRRQCLEQGNRFGTAAEKITIALLEDLLTEVLDWSLADLNHEIEYADLVVTQHGIKMLVIEAKRSGNLAWNQHTIAEALGQARRYADSQRITHLAITLAALGMEWRQPPMVVAVGSARERKANRSMDRFLSC